MYNRVRLRLRLCALVSKTSGFSMNKRYLLGEKKVLSHSSQVPADIEMQTRWELPVEDCVTLHFSIRNKSIFRSR